jgi:hypothetical protein
MQRLPVLPCAKLKRVTLTALAMRPFLSNTTVFGALEKTTPDPTALRLLTGSAPTTALVTVQPPVQPVAAGVIVTLVPRFNASLRAKTKSPTKSYAVARIRILTKAFVNDGAAMDPKIAKIPTLTMSSIKVKPLMSLRLYLFIHRFTSTLQAFLRH